MTETLVVLVVLALLWALARICYRHGYNKEWNKRHPRVICDQCKLTGHRSKVYLDNVITTRLSPNPAYWDEDGNYHKEERLDAVTHYYKCSNGHDFSRKIS